MFRKNGLGTVRVVGLVPGPGFLARGTPRSFGGGSTCGGVEVSSHLIGGPRLTASLYPIEISKATYTVGSFRRIPVEPFWGAIFSRCLAITGHWLPTLLLRVAFVSSGTCLGSGAVREDPPRKSAGGGMRGDRPLGGRSCGPTPSSRTAGLPAVRPVEAVAADEVPAPTDRPMINSSGAYANSAASAWRCREGERMG